jgi:hypothetical protein
MKKASQGAVLKNVYTVPYLIYAYGVPETTFKRWRKKLGLASLAIKAI